MSFDETPYNIKPSLYRFFASLRMTNNGVWLLLEALRQQKGCVVRGVL